MTETIERIGLCRHKTSGSPALFHRLRVKLSRKFRVWPVPGDMRHINLDPSQYSERYRTVESHKPPA